jgi:uncharacterized phage protein (TIGR01671 family)
MREIKFRAWDKHNEIMRSWDELLFPKSKYFGLQWLWTNLPQDHQHVFMQFTGLYDRTGKAIYEGDIVLMNDEARKMYGAASGDGSDVLKHQLVGIHEGCWMTGRYRSDPFKMNTYLWLIVKDIEVIGDCFSNPDLLGESK